MFNISPSEVNYVRPVDISDEEPLRTRWGNRIEIDFTNLDKIDFSNTTCGINPIDGSVSYVSSSSYTPSYVGSQSMNSRSHGGGFSPKYNEYWYPYWSGQTIYRYNRAYSQVGTFNTGQDQMMQVWGDLDGTYYTANWGRNIITKRSDRGANTLWTYNIGSTAGGVCCDNQYVYAMRHYNSPARIHVLSKSTGELIRYITLPSYTYTYGGLAYANGIIYIGGNHGWGGGNYNYRRVNLIDAQTGNYLSYFSVNNNIYGMGFDGENYCISPNSGTIYQYKISDGNSYFGGTADPDSKVRYVQSKVLHEEDTTVATVRLTVTDNKPQGTDILYNITADGMHWQTIAPGENLLFQHVGSQLMINATLSTENLEYTPSIEKIIIEYDLISDPEPRAPSSEVWQPTSTPFLEWNFTDPDTDDHQSDFLIEIFSSLNLSAPVYNSSWINSTKSEHTVSEPLNDGIYYWRALTKDVYHASSNYSVLKKLKVDATKPVGNITIEEGVLTVNDKLIDIVIHASDNGSGVADMQLIGDRGNVGPWEEYITEKRIVLTPTDGLKMIRVRFRDHAGIVSEDFNDTVYFDLKGPYNVIISSPTHPDPNVYYNSTLPVFSWEPPYEETGIKGYSYTVDSTPLTEPTKVLYIQNNDLTGTYPGEFAGLGEGTWYFHITPCDIYDQWGNTTHFQFNIDSVLPMASELIPSGNEWFGDTEVRTEVTFYDRDGYGLDTDSIGYSYRKSGESSFSKWARDGMEFEILEKGDEGYPAKVRAWTNLVFNEGDRNAVMWRGAHSILVGFILVE